MAQWFYQSEGKEVGPIGQAKLRRLAEVGAVSASTLVRKGADGRWISAAKVRGLLGQSDSPLQVADRHGQVQSSTRSAKLTPTEEALSFWEGGTDQARARWLGEDSSEAARKDWADLSDKEQARVMGSLGIPLAAGRATGALPTSVEPRATCPSPEVQEPPPEEASTPTASVPEPKEVRAVPIEPPPPVVLPPPVEPLPAVRPRSQEGPTNSRRRRQLLLVGLLGAAGIVAMGVFINAPPRIEQDNHANSLAPIKEAEKTESPQKSQENLAKRREEQQTGHQVSHEETAKRRGEEWRRQQEEVEKAAKRRVEELKKQSDRIEKRLAEANRKEEKLREAERKQLEADREAEQKVDVLQDRLEAKREEVMAGWRKLEKGMSPDEVGSLLGAADSSSDNRTEKRVFDRRAKNTGMFPETGGWRTVYVEADRMIWQYESDSPQYRYSGRVGTTNYFNRDVFEYDGYVEFSRRRGSSRGRNSEEWRISDWSDPTKWKDPSDWKLP